MAGFEWDPEKNISNLRKHGLSFEEATSIFKGPVLTGPDESAGEVGTRASDFWVVWSWSA
jgi:uncharacterized DUF497 family protein